MTPPSPRPASSAHGRAALAVLAAFTGLYLLLLPGQIRTPDGAVMFRVGQAIVLRGRVDIPELPAYAGFGGQRVEDPQTGESRFYAWFGLGQSLVAVPAIALAAAVEPLVGERERALFDSPRTVEGRASWQAGGRVAWADPRSFRRLWYDTGPEAFADAWQAYGATWTTPLLSAATLALLVLLAGEVGLSLAAAVALALATGLATPMLPYAQTFFSEPLAGLCWTAGAYGLVASRRRPALALFAGLALGFMVLTRVAMAALAAPLLLFWLAEHRRGLPAGLRQAALVVAGATPGLALVLAYNALRFGSPLETGYGEHVDAFTEPLWRGLLGLLASPGRGLLLYAPVAVLGLVGLARLRDRGLALLAALGLLTSLLLYGRWHWWEGGWCWGPRFLVPVLPLLCLGLGTFVDRPLPGRWRWLPAAIVALGFVLTLPLVLVSYHDYHQWLKAWFQANPTLAPGVEHYYELMRWDWRFAPLRALWTFPVRDNFLLPHALAHPGLALAVPAVGLGLLVSGALALSRLLRRERAALTPGGGP